MLDVQETQTLASFFDADFKRFSKVMVFSIEIIQMIVAQKALNLEEFSMDKTIFRIFSGISNAFVAFVISIAAGALPLLLSI